MKKLLAMLILLMLPCALAMAEEPVLLTEGEWEYYLSDEGAGSPGGAVLTGYIAPSPSPEEVVLPVEIGGQPIVAYEFVFLTTAVTGPLRVVVPEGVTDFGNAFYCESNVISEIVLPASLEHIEEGSLLWGDPEITVHPDNPYFTCEGGFLIDQRTSTLLYVAPSGQNSPLPQVQRLGEACLYNYNVMEPVLPDTLTSIGPCVFDEWMDLTHIDIPAGVTEIGHAAFNCAGLTEITLPAGLTAIEPLTFSCTYLTEIVIPEGVERIESWAFYLCPLTRVEIPASCTFVAWDAFDPEVEVVLTSTATHLETLEEYTARNWRDEILDEEGVTHTEGEWEYILTYSGAVIYRWHQPDYPADASVVVELPAALGGEPVIGVAHNALNTSEMYGDVSLTLVFPEGIQWLKEGALQCCHNAEALILPASLTWIPEEFSSHMFADITIAEGNPRYVVRDGFLIDVQSDTLIYICPNAPDELPVVRRIGSSALENYRMTTIVDEEPYPEVHLIIPEGVEVLGAFNFYDGFIDSVTLPESLRVIETDAFYGAWIESGVVVVPAGVEVIEYGAFSLYGTEVQVIVMSPDTHIESAEEYAQRIGESLSYVLKYTTELVFTPGWDLPTEGDYAYYLTSEGAVITEYLYGECIPESITVPDTLGGMPVVGVDAWAFYTMDVSKQDDDGIAFVRLPEGLRFIDAEAFRCAHDIEALYLPASLEVIPEGAFDHFEGEIIPAEGSPFVSLGGFLIDTRSDTLLYAAPSSMGRELPAVRRYGTNALVGWGEDFDLPLVIPEGVEVIGNHAFYDFCYASISLPSTLKVLETSAFECIFVQEPIIVPASVELIEYGAFGLYSPTDADVIVMSPDTHIETAQEYAARTGEALDDVLDYTWPTEPIPGWK